MEEIKRGRGRPRIDTHIVENYYPSRRQAVNKTYMHEGAFLLTAAAAEIPNSEVLHVVDRVAYTVKTRDGILEQIGRMVMQDELPHADCIYFTNLAIAAVQAGRTTREVEIALRKIRMAAKICVANPKSKFAFKNLHNTVELLKNLGGIV